MSESTIVIAVIGLISSVVVAIIAYLQHNGSKIAEKNSNDFRELIAAQKVEIKSAKEERDAAIAERDKAQAERDLAKQESAAKDRIIMDKDGQIADRDELISDYRAFHDDLDRWEAGGLKPPSPERSWRLKNDLTAWVRSKGILDS